MTAMLNIAMLILGGDGPQGGLLDVNPGLIVWTIVTFIFLLLVLKKLAWKPILNSLNERETFIKEQMEKAETAQKETERLIEENKASMAKADEEAQKIIAQARELAEKLQSQKVEETNEKTKKMIDDAVAEIDRKNKEAMNNLREQVAEIAVNAAEKIIRESLDSEKHKKIVNELIDNLPKN